MNKTDILKHLISAELKIMRSPHRFTRLPSDAVKGYCRLIHKIRISAWIAELRRERAT